MEEANLVEKALQEKFALLKKKMGTPFRVFKKKIMEHCCVTTMHIISNLFAPQNPYLLILLFHKYFETLCIYNQLTTYLVLDAEMQLDIIQSSQSLH